MEILSQAFTSTLPQEFQLILACLSNLDQKKESNLKHIEALAHGNIDWKKFVWWVDRHRVAPLVYQALRRSPYLDIPSHVLQRLKTRFEKNTFRAMALTSELIILKELLGDNGIPVRPLKGTALALQLYGNPALRYAGDIDLLIPFDHVRQADQLIRDRGYRCISPDPRHMAPSLWKRFHDLHHDLTYINDARQVKLEIHWRLSEYNHLLPIEAGLFQHEGQNVTIAGRSLVTLTPEVTLLYLCVHGAFHAWRRLFWLCDVAVFLHNRYDIDWSGLIRFANQLGSDRTLGQGVALAHQLLNTPLPAPMQQVIERDKMLPRLTRAAVNQMLLPDPHQLSPGRELINQTRLKVCYEPRLYPGLGHKIAILKSDAFLRPEDWEIVRLPGPLFPLYYLLRPFSWLWRRLVLQEPLQK